MKHLNLARNRKHISPGLASLHWLPVEYRVKLLRFCCMCRGLMARPHSTLQIFFSTGNVLCPYCPQTVLMLSVPRSRLKLKGHCAISVAATGLWDELLVHTDADSFKSSLKVYLFFFGFWISVILLISVLSCYSVYFIVLYFLVGFYILFIALWSVLPCLAFGLMF